MSFLTATKYQYYFQKFLITLDISTKKQFLQQKNSIFSKSFLFLCDFEISINQNKFETCLKDILRD